jgi:hypothetical protein
MPQKSYSQQQKQSVEGHRTFVSQVSFHLPDKNVPIQQRITQPPGNPDQKRESKN